MSNTTEDLEIEVEKDEDQPETTVIVEKEPETQEKGNIDQDEGIKDLKLKLEQERMARSEAERQARQAQQQVHQANNEVHDSNLQLVRNAIETVKGTSEHLKRAYAEALSVGDYGKSAEIQEAMSINSARLMELERGRVAMENAPPQAAQQTAPQQQRVNDPVEALASQLSSKSADWVRKNPQCVTDPRLYQKMVAAHNLAVADGYSPDSDDYFGFIEDTLKINQRRQAPARVEAETDDPLSSASAPAQRRSAPPAAPVTRAGTASGQRPDVVRLSRAEAETARDLGMTEKEYALNKQLLKKEGRL
jgi:hypothetical protein